MILSTTGWDPRRRPWLRGHPDRWEPWPQWSGSWPLAPQAHRAIDDLGAATNSCMMPSKTRWWWSRPRQGPCCIRRLANHHHAYSAAMAGTVAPRHTMSRRGHKIMTTTTPIHTPQYDIACKPSKLGPPLGSLPFGRENLLLCICPGPELYIRAARAPILGIQLSFIHFYTIEGLLKLPFGQPVSQL
jgi:hypothetical protein